MDFNNYETLQTYSQSRDKNGTSSSVWLLVRTADENTKNSIFWMKTKRVADKKEVEKNLIQPPHIHRIEVCTRWILEIWDQWQYYDAQQLARAI